MKSRPFVRIAGALSWLLPVLATQSALAQDLEPRRWSHLPLGANFAGIAYAYTDAEVAFDPVLQISDATFDRHIYALKYLHAFELFGKSARIDFGTNYQTETWDGLLEGIPTNVRRSGWGDPAVRFAVNLFGAPPLEGQEFADYRAKTKCETIIGAGLTIRLPLGEYFDDRLINIGSNRFTFIPQIGAVRTVGKWSFELNATASFFSSNKNFWNGHLREQDSLGGMDAHIAYTFRPGLWIAASGGFIYGGESSVDGIAKADTNENYGWAITAGIPINRQLGIKVGYLVRRAQRETGSDSNSAIVAVAYLW